MLAALSAAALAMGAVSVPLAHADDLKDRRERIEDRIKHADDDLDHSSARMRRAMSALDTAQQIESHLVTRSYEGFAGPKGPRIRGRKGCG